MGALNDCNATSLLTDSTLENVFMYCTYTANRSTRVTNNALDARSKLGLVQRVSPPFLAPSSLSLPLLPFPAPFSHHSLHPSPSLRSRTPLFQLGDLGERCKLPQGDLGRSPSQNRFWCILAFKSGIWWQQF